jgi:hypothetical protein
MDAKGLDSQDGVSFRIMFVIRAEMAREERERSKDRNKAKARRLRLAGRWPGGPAPYGYTIVDVTDGEGRTLAIEPTEAAALNEAADRVLLGDPLGRVVRHLNTHGPRPRRAPEWSRVTLRQCLTGDHLLGRIVLNGVAVRDDDGKAVTPFPEVMPLGKLQRVRAALAQTPDDRKKGGRRPSRLLSRLIQCRTCGAYLQVIRRPAYRTKAERESGRAGRSGMIGYRCQRRADGGICAAPTIVTARLVEEFVEAQFLWTAGKLPLIERRVVVIEDGELAEIEDRLASVLSELGASATPEKFAELQRLQNDRARLASAPSEPFVEMIDTGRTLAEEWAARDLDGRREMLADAFEVISIGPGKRGKREFDPSRLLLVWSGEGGEALDPAELTAVERQRRTSA